MASTSNNPTPTPSVLTLVPTKWEVFISFRGKDTRYTFTDFLYDSLKRTGIRTFRDDPELRSGEVISDALIQAIKESKMYIVVFSENYASSRWCLDELVEIESMGRLVIPVFYYIEPMVVRHQIGSFHEAFREHGNRYNADRLVKWRETLTNVADLSGYNVLKNSSQADVINEIVSRTLQEVNPVILDVAKYEVGLDSRVKDIATLLSNVTEGVIKIGLYGMGGVGKTTLAKAVFKQNYYRFKGSCFLENVREASQTRKGIADLQQKLVNDVLKCTDITIDNADHGIELIRARICSTKILVIIDDLDRRDQFGFLVGPFALGSTIIITTRDEGLLDSVDVEAKYKVNELGDVESRQLFCQHAFGRDNIMPDTFIELSKEILNRVAGLPLALRVCGSALFKKSEEGWRCYIDKLRRVPIADVEEILLISFYALVDPMLKDMFLDIACFFKGYKQDEAIEIMETCYTSANYNIDILKERCLLTVNDDERFMMHDLIVDMGRRIACNNSPHEFEKHSRLWKSEIIQEVLKDKKGTEAIQGIIPSNFQLPRHFIQGSSGRLFSTPSKLNHFAAETFKRMSKLRFLHLKNVNLTGSFERTFKDLRWLYWECCPLNCFPSDFNPQKLVFLALLGSEMRTMWKLNTVGTVLENLKTLDMSYSRKLTTAPDFTRLPCLENLNLNSCESLKEVPILPGSLLRLVSLNLGWCKNLKSLPDSICNLTTLKSLNIDGCITLKAIPLNFGNIESLAELNAHDLNICKLPQSIGRLSKLIQLNLSSCENLKTLPISICNLRSLKILNIDRCRSLGALPTELGNLESLVELNAYDLIICKLPQSIGRLSKLIELNLSYCENLKTLPDPICNLRSLKFLDICGCRSLEALPTELGNLESLVELQAEGLTVSELPNSIGRLSKLVVLNLNACHKLKTLPDTICNLTSLNILCMDYCSSLEALPTELGNLESLVSLYAAELPNILKLPDSIGHIKSLEKLSLISCSNLLSIGELPSSLKEIILHECTAMERLPNLSNMKQLKKLVLTSCRGLREIQGLEGLTSIRTLYLGGCNMALLKSTLTKRFFEIYSGFGHMVTVFAPSSVFPDWITESPDCISETVEISPSDLTPPWINYSVSLDLPSNRSHNFLALILRYKFLRDGTAFSCVTTTTNTIAWCIYLQTDPSDDYREFSYMDIVPRTKLSLTEEDRRIEFKARLGFYKDMETYSGNAEILGIHLLYKPENTIIDECTPSM